METKKVRVTIDASQLGQENIEKTCEAAAIITLEEDEKGYGIANLIVGEVNTQMCFSLILALKEAQRAIAKEIAKHSDPILLGKAMAKARESSPEEKREVEEFLRVLRGDN